MLLLFTQNVSAEQVVITDYKAAKKNYFWKHIYSKNGNRLYCNLKFNNKGINYVKDKKSN